MKLTADQEKFVRMSGQALAEWREGLGPYAWLILGLLLLAGLLTAIAALRFVLRGGLRPGRPNPPLDSKPK